MNSYLKERYLTALADNQELSDRLERVMALAFERSERINELNMKIVQLEKELTY